MAMKKQAQKTVKKKTKKRRGLGGLRGRCAVNHTRRHLSYSKRTAAVYRA